MPAQCSQPVLIRYLIFFVASKCFPDTLLDAFDELFDADFASQKSVFGHESDEKTIFSVCILIRLQTVQRHVQDNGGSVVSLRV